MVRPCWSASRRTDPEPSWSQRAGSELASARATGRRLGVLRPRPADHRGDEPGRAGHPDEYVVTGRLQARRRASSPGRRHRSPGRPTSAGPAGRGTRRTTHCRDVRRLRCLVVADCSTAWSAVKPGLPMEGKWRTRAPSPSGRRSGPAGGPRDAVALGVEVGRQLAEGVRAGELRRLLAGSRRRPRAVAVEAWPGPRGTRGPDRAESRSHAVHLADHGSGEEESTDGATDPDRGVQPTSRGSGAPDDEGPRRRRLGQLGQRLQVETGPRSRGPRGASRTRRWPAGAAAGRPRRSGRPREPSPPWRWSASWVSSRVRRWGRVSFARASRVPSELGVEGLVAVPDASGVPALGVLPGVGSHPGLGILEPRDLAQVVPRAWTNASRTALRAAGRSPVSA